MNEDIYHWGIKGQKWGVRRYQNKDGSLTPAGKKRYSQDYIDAHSEKSVSEMSDAELRKRNNRLQMEQQYAQLTRKKSKVDSAVKTIVKGSGTVAGLMAAYATYKKLYDTIKGATDSAIGGSVGDMFVKFLMERGLY